jgi:hypothetical protein
MIEYILLKPFFFCNLYMYIQHVFYLDKTNDYRLRLTNDRPDLSSDRAPKKETRQKTSDIKLLKENNIWS